MVSAYKIPSVADAETNEKRARAFRRLSDKALVQLKDQFAAQLGQIVAELDRRGDRMAIPGRVN